MRYRNLIRACSTIQLALAVLSFAAPARASTIEFAPTTLSPNTTGSSNTGAYGSDANVSVGYSAYTYNWTPGGYGGLNSGTGVGIYSESGPDDILTMTFTAAAGYTVTLDSFDLAQYLTSSDSVNISVTGGASSYSLTGATPAGGTGFTTYSPDETGTSLTLTITKLYDVGLNEITYSEVAAATPLPSTWTMMILGFAGIGFMAYRRKNTPALMAT